MTTANSNSAMPWFLEPDGSTEIVASPPSRPFADGPRPHVDSDAYTDAPGHLPGSTGYAAALQEAVSATADVNPASDPITAEESLVRGQERPAEGPTPVLEGSFALYITPDSSIVLAYRPTGATEDKHLQVPAFIVEMAARQTGHSVSELLAGLGGAL